MKNSKKQSVVFSQKVIRNLALLFVALLSSGAVLVLGGFEIEWNEVWKGFLKM